MNPLVSIIIPTHNGEKTLPRALKSALEQDYDSKEIIVIDDASTDETKKILMDFQKQYPQIIRIATNGKNLRVTKTLIKLVEMSQGKYIAHLDDDDYYTYRRKTRDQVAILEQNPKITLVTSWCDLLFPNGTTATRRTPPTDETIKRRMYEGTNPIVHSTTLFRKSDALKIGNYDSSFQTTQDLDLWLRLGSQGKITTLPQSTLTYEVKENSISGKKRWRQAQDVIRALHKNRKNYKKYYATYPYALFRIATRQIVASLLPRNLIMRIKYRLS